MPLPEDYENGAAGLLEDVKENGKGEGYPRLVPLAQRQTTGVKLSGGEQNSEADLIMKFGYSMPMATLTAQTKKLYGYMRDANLSDPLAQSAVMRVNSLNDLIMAAPCVNRQARYDEEERRAKMWEKQMVDEAEHRPRVEEMLNQWSEANAYLLQARITEELRGIDGAARQYPKDEVLAMQRQQDDALMEASKLPLAYNMFFWCRVRQASISRERAYDLSMGYPTEDFSDIIKLIVKGDYDVNDQVPQLTWAFQEGYQLVMGSMLDGETFRSYMVSLMAQEHPRQPAAQNPWGAPPGYWPNGMGPEDDEEKDKRGALFGLFDRKPEPQGPKPLKRRSRGQ